MLVSGVSTAQRLYPVLESLSGSDLRADQGHHTNRTRPLPSHLVTPESFPDSYTVTRHPPAPASTGLVQEQVRSARTELLTSESLKELKRVIQTAHEEHEDITGQLRHGEKREGNSFPARLHVGEWLPVQETL